jgi:hypothetical protein
VIVVGTGCVLMGETFATTISVRHTVPFAPAPRYTAGIRTSPASAGKARRKKRESSTSLFMVSLTGCKVAGAAYPLLTLW